MLIQKQSSEQEVDAVSRRALSKIVEFGLPLTPETFAVWHGYYSGNFPALKQTIDQKLNNGKRVSATDAEELYFRYLSSQSQGDTLDTVSGELGSLMQGMLGQLSAATQQTSEYADALNDFQQKLEDEKAEDASTAVAEIIKKTTEIRREHSDLYCNMEVATKSIAGLKQNLDANNIAVSRDELTQVANWLAIHKELRRQAISCTENDEPLAIVIIDIDGFSKFNERHGRDLGNSVLCLLANIVSDTVGDRGMAGRYGADEFIIVLQEASANDAAVMTEDLRERIGTRQFKNKKTEENYGSVTISAAVGDYIKGEAIADLVQRTSDALDRAKQDGGNRIAFAQKQKSNSSTTRRQAAGR